MAQPATSTLTRLAFAATIVLALAIGYFTLAPVSGSGVPGSDKSHHFLAFFALTLPLSFAQSRHALWITPLAVAYGGAIELIQPFVGRDKDAYDFLADALGAGGGAALGVALYWLRSRARIVTEP